MHTVMIVEDEPIIRDAVAQELSKWNYQVECVTDFNQVMDDFVKVNPQLVILDITLPFLMVIIGVRKFVKFRMCQFYFYLLTNNRWILLCRSIWGQMTILRNLLKCRY